MRKRRNISGLGQLERSIMELWDRGFSVERIAGELRIGDKIVLRNLYTFEGADEHRVECRMMAAGSQALLAALTRARAGA